MGIFSRITERRRHAEFEREALPHMNALYGTALRLTRSRDDAEDLVQDALLKAYRFYDRYEAGTNFKAWLLKILTNTFINRYRRKVRERRVFDGVMADPVGDGVMSRAAMRHLMDPRSEAERGLIGREIEAALDELPPDHRMIILLADVEELSYKEISEILGCPIGTVMSRLHRARSSMRSRLLQQAVELGIVAEDSPAGAEPISIDAFRRRREVAG